MNQSIRIRPGVNETPAYKAGLPISLVAREHGLDPMGIIKLASNENPLGPAPKAVEAVRAALSELHRYPDGGAWELTQKLSTRIGLPGTQILVGNGSNELLELLAQVLLEPGSNAVMGEFPFVVYPLLTTHFGAKVRKVPMPGLKHDLPAMLDAIDANTRIVFLASPNNPTPYHVNADELHAFIEHLPEHVVLCFDEAYCEYLDQPVSLVPQIVQGKSILCVRTFSKIYGIAGLRVGYGYGPEWLIGLLARTRQPFSVNALALAGASAALEDEAHVQRSREANHAGILQMTAGLSRLGLSFHAGAANFVLVKVPEPDVVCSNLLKKGVIVRSMASFSLDGMIRVSIGLPAENERFLQSLAPLVPGIRS